MFASGTRCVCIFVVFSLFSRSHLDVLHVDFDEADFVGFRQQLDACDAAELRQRGQDAQLVVDHLTHSVTRSDQQGHRRLPVLELSGSVRRQRGSIQNKES